MDKKLDKKTIRAIACLCVALAVTAYTGKMFLDRRELDVHYPSEHVTEVKMLSDYFDGLKDTNGDTEIYVIKGSKPGGSTLVLGGTHPNEPSGYLAALLLVERARVEQGTLYVIPMANKSAFTHNDPGDAAPDKLHITTPSGVRTFRYGSRATNPIDQWPDPDAYIHAASGQQLSGTEVRNLNRAYPGRPDGNFTEKVAYGVVQLIKAENITMTIDLHEASPEYPNIDSTVAHERAMVVAAPGIMQMQISGIKIKLEPSPVNLRGLTHRELGDYTDTFALLMETANAAQGRTRGATNERLALTGKDKCYEILVNYGLLYVPYDENGHPIEERVGRHLSGILEYTASLTKVYPDKAVIIADVPDYFELMSDGVSLGDYLH